MSLARAIHAPYLEHLLEYGRLESDQLRAELSTIRMVSTVACCCMNCHSWLLTNKKIDYSLFHAPFNTLEHSAVQCSKELSASTSHPRGTHASSPCRCTVEAINWLAGSVLWTVKARLIFFHTASTCRFVLWATVGDSSSKIRCWKLHEAGCSIFSSFSFPGSLCCCMNCHRRLLTKKKIDY